MKKTKGTMVWTDSNDQEFTVHFQYCGRYYPATMEEPAEYPELEILSIVDKDGKEVEFSEKVENEIYDYVEENYKGED